MKVFKSFHPYAATTIFFWSLAYVLTRLTMEYISAFSLGFFRYGIASLTLLPICFIMKVKIPNKRDMPWFIAAGVTGFFLYVITFNIGTGQVSAATSSVIIASVPVFTALAASVLMKEKLKTYQWIAIAVEFTGIMILTLYDAVFTANGGIVWLLIAALLLSCYNLIQRRLLRTYTALQATIYSILIGTLLLLVFLPQAFEEVKKVPSLIYGYLFLLGVFSSAAAYVCWSKAFEKAEKTSMVSNYMFFTPFITGILGFWLAGEVPDQGTWIGGAFIIAGALLFNRKERR